MKPPTMASRTTAQTRPAPESGSNEPEFTRVGELREDRSGVGHAEMAADDFGEDAAEIGGDRQVAAVVALLAREARPAAVDLAAAHVLPADDHHRVAVAVI